VCSGPAAKSNADNKPLSAARVAGCARAAERAGRFGRGGRAGTSLPKFAPVSPCCPLTVRAARPASARPAGRKIGPPTGQSSPFALRMAASLHAAANQSAGRPRGPTAAGPAVKLACRRGIPPFAAA